MCYGHGIRKPKESRVMLLQWLLIKGEFLFPLGHSLSRYRKGRDVG